jgi:3-hydroxyisobutyrate dehydrogenase
VTGRSARRYTSATSPDVGFIGLGQMGYRMAQNLLKNGKKVIAYDIALEPVNKLASEGATTAKSPKEVAASKAPIIVTMLPSSPHVRSCYIDGNDSLVAGLQEGQLFVDASTIDPAVAREIHTLLTSLGCFMVDAPVSGGIVGAQNATLTFMVGGTEEAFEKVKPTLQLMGKNITYCGGSGNGQVVKIANNLVLGISMIGVSEAMNLGIKLGMDPKILASVLNTSSARCWSSDSYNPVPGVVPGVPSSNDYNGGFGVDLMAKDLSLAVGAAHAIREALPLGGSALQVYNLLSAKGMGKKDFSCVYKFLEESKKE